MSQEMETCVHVANLRVAENALREEPYKRLPALAGSLALAAHQLVELQAENDRLKQPKMAPVQGYSAIPWEMHLRAYEAYCKKCGPQKALIDLEGKNCRGGFHVDELEEFIPGWREELSEISRLRELEQRVQAVSVECHTFEEMFGQLQQILQDNQKRKGGEQDG